MMKARFFVCEPGMHGGHTGAFAVVDDKGVVDTTYWADWESAERFATSLNLAWENER